MHAVRVPVAAADAESAAEFYSRVFGAEVSGAEPRTIDLHGIGTLEIIPSGTSLATGFPRVVVTYVLDQPAEVRALMETASARGARVLKPAKRALFGSFAGSFIGPEGLVWKLTSDKAKDTASPVSHYCPVCQRKS